MDDGIKSQPAWILFMGVPSAVSALITGLLLGAPVGSAVGLALAFGSVMGVLTFAMNKVKAGRD